MNLKGDLGYGLKGPESAVFSQCHEREDSEGFLSIHNKHVKASVSTASSATPSRDPKEG